MRFFVGLVVGLSAAGGWHFYQTRQQAQTPCLGRCGIETVCDNDVCVPVKKRTSAKRRRRRKSTRTNRKVVPGLKQPTAEDLKSKVVGPRLNSTDYVDLEADGEPNERELSEQEVSNRVRRLNPRILQCIDQARGDYDISQGRVTVAFRVERTGEVQKVRVSAPGIMMRAGLHGCIATQVRTLRFAKTGRSLILTYPYALR